VLQLIPMVTSIVSTQFWAPLFDRVHISTFRVAQGFVSTTAHALMLSGALTNQLWLVAVAQFVIGVSNAAGNVSNATDNAVSNIGAPGVNTNVPMNANMNGNTSPSNVATVTNNNGNTNTAGVTTTNGNMNMNGKMNMNANNRNRN